MAAFDDNVLDYESSVDLHHLGRPVGFESEPFPYSYGAVFEDSDVPFSDFPDQDFSQIPPDAEPSAISCPSVASEARTLLFRYAGDLYGDPSSFTGAQALEGRPTSANRERGLFVVKHPPPVSGITLPEEFVSAF